MNINPMILPEYISGNLNQKFSLRPYQYEAFNRLVLFTQNVDKFQSNGLFHMATGSGKTMIMAMSILHLYTKGYRRFVFFVNNLNIVEKTRQNFVERGNSKFLFNHEIRFSGKQVDIKEVDVFNNNAGEQIQIIFTTVQSLHARMLAARENSLSYQSLSAFPVVFLSDEAHHLSAETLSQQKLSEKEKALQNTWENSILKLIDGNKGHLLLEFTATANLSHPLIAAKYRDKVLFDYSLSQFRLDGYSKEITLAKWPDVLNNEMISGALILSHIRGFIAQKHHIQLKPVVLFKSGSILASHENFARIRTFMQECTCEDLKAALLSENAMIKLAAAHMRTLGISCEDMVHSIRQSATPEAFMVIDSANEYDANTALLNQLEAPWNEVRYIFAVGMLDEGWDVLNLFDIVRLIPATHKKFSKNVTNAEAQLIGRGARYYPFKFGFQPKDKRKFDTDETHPLRMLEVLTYHSGNESAYIHSLLNSLSEIGLPVLNRISVSFTVNSDIPFSTPSLYFPRTQYANNIQLSHLAEALPQMCLYMGEENDRQLFELNKVHASGILRAIKMNAFYKFNKLSSVFPALKSLQEFIQSPNYLGGLKIYTSDLPNTDEQCIELLSQILAKVQQHITTFCSENEPNIEWKKYDELVQNKLVWGYEHDWKYQLQGIELYNNVHMAYSGGMMNEEQHTILKTLMEQSHDEVEYLFIPFFGEVSIPLPNSEIQLNPIAAVVSYGGAKSTVHFIVPGISLLAPPVLTYPNESVQLVLTDLPIVL